MATRKSSSGTKIGERQNSETAGSVVLIPRYTCNFGQNLDSYLRDRFIVGLSNHGIKHSILNSNPNTFNEALSMVIESLRDFCPLVSRTWLDKLCTNWRENLFSNLNVRSVCVVVP